MSNPVLDVVDNILISKDYWTKHSWAKDSYGWSVDAADPAACKFCLTGAMAKASNITRAGENAAAKAEYNLTRAVSTLYGFNSIVLFNDHAKTKFADVKAVIAYAKAM